MHYKPRVDVRILALFPLALVCACAAKLPHIALPVPVLDLDAGFAVAADSSIPDLTERPAFDGLMDLLEPSRLQRKIVRGRLLAPDRERWDGFHILVRSAWRIDSARISPIGDFSVALSDVTADSADLLVRGATRASAYHTVRIGLETRGANAATVLVPTHWTINAGTYTGTTVRISARAVTSRGLDRSRFARFHRADDNAQWKSVGWRAMDLPLSLVFARDSAGPVVAPRDSAAFWRAVRLLEVDLGSEFFRPAMLYEVVESDSRVVVRIDPELHANGVTSVAWGPRANLYGVEVAFQSVRQMHDRAIAMHELLHTLGFGHTSSWYSIMRAGARRAARATAEDVAYVQMLFRLRQIETTSGALHGLMAAIMAHQEP
ncbi:MAG: hypothetical protein ACR2G6_10915 [Gemmatimonadaceae bacterium]